MYRLRLAFEPDDQESVLEAIAGFCTTGIDEGNLASGETEFWVYFHSLGEARGCASSLARWSPAIEDEPEENWNAAWQDAWQPMRVGARWWLVPPGHTGGTPEGRIRLELHRGIAFGNGDHPTTQLCLEWMEELIRPGDVFADIGCGSGLLLEAARALGASAAGCDLDSKAARQRGLPVYTGSADALRAADVIVANIHPGVLEGLLPELHRAARREIIVSGLLAGQADRFPGQRKQSNGWAAIRLPR
jgi:ribosomal protein L11 methylase PrmA